MFYCEFDKELFLKTIYKSIYYEKYVELTSDKNSDLKIESGYEIHHIIPRCFGGGNEINNLAKLTTKNHILAHYYLALMTEHIYMFQSFNCMLGKQFKKLSDLEVIELENFDNWANLRDTARKRVFSDKAKATISEKAKKRWENFNNTGKIETVKNNISKQTKEKMQDPEILLKVRANLGSRWYYNPEIDKEIHWYEGQPIPEYPWRRGRKPKKEYLKKQQVEYAKKRPSKWYYNDELQINKRFYIDEEIPDGWKPGQPIKYRGNRTKLLMKNKIETYKKLKKIVNS